MLSDHGQTLGGDHGGGTPAETDTVLIAMDLRKMHSALQTRSPMPAAHVAGKPGSQQQLVQDTPTLPAAQQQVHYSQYCAANKEPNAAGISTVLQHLMDTGGYVPAEATPWRPAVLDNSTACQQQQCWPWLCGSTMSQIDLTPLLAHLLGVPVPYGNLGKVPPHLFVAMAREHSLAGSSLDWLPDYAAALDANADQVIKAQASPTHCGGCCVLAVQQSWCNLLSQASIAGRTQDLVDAADNHCLSGCRCMPT